MQDIVKVKLTLKNSLMFARGLKKRCTDAVNGPSMPSTHKLAGAGFRTGPEASHAVVRFNSMSLEVRELWQGDERGPRSPVPVAEMTNGLHCLGGMEK